MKLSDKHRKDLQDYVAYYKGKEEIYGTEGWAMPLAYGIEVVLGIIDGSNTGGVSAKHLETMRRYVEYYKPKEEIRGDYGYPTSIAHAIEAALSMIDELERAK